MNRPNIFNYAKKELSMDAMVCWLLQCVKCDEPYKSIGEDFIKSFIFNNEAEAKDIRLLMLEKQCHRIDVFAVIRIGNTIHPVIFENKIDTFLSNNQFIDYSEKVLIWTFDNKHEKWREQLANENNCQDCKWGDVWYILFKTGYIFEADKEFFAEKKREIVDKHSKDKFRAEIRDIDDILKFLQRHEEVDKLIADYYESCDIERKCQQTAYASWNSANSAERNASLGTHIGQTQLFKYTFEDAHDRAFHRGSNSGIWISHSITYDYISKWDYEQIHYDFRFDWRKNADTYEQAFIFQQYRNEKGVKGNKIKEKQDDFLYAFQLCEKIIAELCESKKYSVHPEPLKSPSFNGKLYNAKEIFRIFINDDNLPKEVGDFVSDFTKEFLRQYTK